MKKQYYLHENGSVVYKPFGGIFADSDSGGFVIKVWNCEDIGKSPETYYEWLKELKSLGANTERIRELVKVNRLQDFFSDDQLNELLD